MRKHTPTSTLRPPRIQRRREQSDTMVEYLDWRDSMIDSLDVSVAERFAAFKERFLK